MLVILTALFLAGCGAAVQSPVDPAKARADARAVVIMAVDVWNASGNACIELVQQTSDTKLAQKCDEVMTPASKTIKAAADAVDAWNDVTQKNWPCTMAAVVDSLEQINKLVPSLTGKIPPLVTDTLVLAKNAASSCSNLDGGK